MKGKNHVVFSSGNDEWETPRDLFEKLDREFHFTLDACASEANRKCDRYYTREDNGLDKPWRDEVVWCNPPYSKIKAWVEKAENERNREGATVVMLVPARTDTQWFHNHVYGKAEVRFLRGRIRFQGAEHNAPFPSMIVIYR